MKQYRTDQIRNIAIIAHSGAGKTSLVEAMLFNGGAIERMGAVDSGNSVADYAADEIERRRPSSVQSVSQNGKSIN